MSMLDGFFKRTFNSSKCKTMLKLTIPRIKLLRNRREIQLKQMRKDIAKLLETGQEATARIRVEHIVREENMMAAQEIVELFCELISVRLPIIETQRECPLDLKEAISSICFAAPRCADLPELQQVRMLFASKYGREFVAAATELMPDCGVNRQLIELLSIRPPSAETKLKLLKEIAEEHEIDWDPAASESEFSKPHEDLLNGPSQFLSGSKLPLPKEKHSGLSSTTPDQTHNGESEEEDSIDSLNLPEVPKASLRPSSNSASAPEMFPLPASVDFDSDSDIAKSAETKDDITHQHPPQHETIVPQSADASAGPTVSTREDKQFLPFVSLPSHSLSRVKSDANADSDQDVNNAKEGGALSSSTAKQSDTDSSSLRTKIKADADLQDVLAAAQAAAETAERAAVAARSAASLAQVRISEILKNRNTMRSETTEVSPQIEESYKPSFVENSQEQLQSSVPQHISNQGSVSQSPLLNDSPKRDSREHTPEYHRQSSHQPQRLTSLEDDAYFSYPNLFASQDSNLRNDIYAPAGNSPPAHRPE